MCNHNLLLSVFSFQDTIELFEKLIEKLRELFNQPSEEGYIQR